MSLQPFILDRVYLPAVNTDEEEVRRHYEQRLYDENKCVKCKNLEYRHNDICQRCPAYKGRVKLWSKVVYKDNHEYYALPSGHLKRVAKLFGYEVKDFDNRTKRVPMRHPITWTGSLYHGETVINELGEKETRPNQELLIRTWHEKGRRGLIESPPRTGKTVLAVNIICELQTRALIVTRQLEWLWQFRATFDKFTNIKRLEDKHGPRIAILDNDFKDWDNLHRYDVVMTTYQKFISEERGVKRMADYLVGQFGLVVVDEVHQAGADAYSLLLNRLDVRYKLGLTATPERKDNRIFIVRDIIGPVVARGLTTNRLPWITLWETGVKGFHKQWHTMEAWMVKNDKRNEIIVRQVFEDLKANPKHSILIPCSQRAHIKQLVGLINREAEIQREVDKIDWGYPLAVPYYREVNKKKLLEAVSTFQSRVVVAIRSMTQHALDVPNWTHVYVGIIPISNPPMYYQLTNRVCTHYAGKPDPVVRHLIDDHTISVNCFKNSFFQEVFPKLRPKEGPDGWPRRYRMQKVDFDRAMEIAKHPRSYSPLDKPKGGVYQPTPFMVGNVNYSRGGEAASIFFEDGAVAERVEQRLWRLSRRLDPVKFQREAERYQRLQRRLNRIGDL